MSEFLPITLPSKCKTYGVDPASIAVRPYTGADEVFLAEITPHNLNEKFLHVLKRVVKGVDPAVLTLGDRLYILLWECAKSYTQKVPVRVLCSSCLKEVSVHVDLGELEAEELPDDYEQPYSIKLPDAGRDIALQLLTVADEIAVDRYDKQSGGDNTHYFRIARTVVSNDDHLTKIDMLKKLSARDLAHIRAFQEEFAHGPVMETDITCPECGEKENILIPFRFEYLYPSGNFLRDITWTNV